MGSVTDISEKKFVLLSVHFIKYPWVINISKAVHLSVNEGDVEIWYTSKAKKDSEEQNDTVTFLCLECCVYAGKKCASFSQLFGEAQWQFL